jgi:sterol desaturase/sphingolipid hydroxylase (fatty acid hydroxylase superfamily)
MRTLHTFLSYTLWPFFLVSSLMALKILWDSSIDPELATFYVYIGFFVVLLATEYLLPYKKAWLKNIDGQTPIDLTLTVLYFVANGLAIVFVLKFLVWLIDNYQALISLNIWPTDWPMWAQITLGIIVTDFGNNMAHRMAHEVPLLWRFHAVHHSAPRICVINTGRFHPVDVIQSLIVGTPVPFFLGAPDAVIIWYAAFNAYLGIMTHSNIDFRCGIFNHIFNTPNVHRWHHSRIISEGNNNYGEVTILWDRFFGTYLYPDAESRKPPVNVGTGTRVPKTFLGLLIRPLTIRGYSDEEETLSELSANAE